MAHNIHLPIRTLAEFLLRGGSLGGGFSGLDRGAQGSRLHRRLQRQAGSGYTAEAPLSLSVEDGGFCYHLSGRADGVLETPGGLWVDEIKTVTQPLAALREDSHPEHWAQGCCYAHILCVQRGLSACGVQLSYCHVDSGEVRRFAREYSAAELAEFVTGLLAQYRRWAKMATSWAEARNASLRALTFPFEAYRGGQRDMAIACYNAYRDGGRLYCCAPTGIGKTLSALFPAMKALGEGYGERIFYLTAKTVARKAAEDALGLLGAGRGGAAGGQALAFRSITLTAKDKICFLEKRDCRAEGCPYADGYYDRRNDAVYDILQRGGALGREAVEAYARQYRLCPYELALDLATWCDCVIGDYNYLFDPVVHLQRFFEGKGGDYLFLVDEAHNLVERGREMYSAELRKSDFYEFKKLLPKRHKGLHKALAGLNTAFVGLRKACDAAETRVLPLPDAPPALGAAAEKFCLAAASFLEDERGGPHEEALLALYFAALFYGRIAAEYDERYVTLVHRGHSEVSAKLFCRDAAAFLDESLGLGRGAVLFSATLQPLPYYRETLGGTGEAAGAARAKLLLLHSPFPQENLGLFVADGVSTKYADRPASLAPVADLLAAMAAGKKGNYIAYFPSYAYMRQVLKAFERRHPGLPTLVQQSGMEEAAREEFLAAFRQRRGETLLGFCVLGGIFAEGVDLPGEALIGSAVAGVGLPQIGPEPDTIREWYDEKRGRGFEYAYQFPGMNKVLQAAGRVIRTGEDKGVVLLIDSRFSTPRYQAMFPPHWAHWRRVDGDSLPEELSRFWGQGLPEPVQGG